MADMLDSIRKELAARLKELRPLVLEYERLQAAERALTDGSPGGQTGRQRSRASATSPRRRSPSRAAGRRSVLPAERAASRDRILALVGERPGISKAELRQATGLSGAGVAQNLRRMVGRGEVREEQLPGGEVGYRLGGGEPATERSAPEQAGDS